MRHAAELRAILKDLDIVAMRAFDRVHNPHLPAQDDDQIRVSMHAARTACESLPFALRAYSHSWLTERGLPSLLPDHLKPKAQRLYPVIAVGVGIAVKSRSPHMREAVKEIRIAMEDAVKEAVEDRQLNDSVYVKGRMMAARSKAVHRLFG